MPVKEEKAMLQLRAIGFGFVEQPLFAGWSADFAPGVSLVIGDESAGKTTLLRLLARELAPTQGSVCWRGVDVAALPDWESQVFWRDPRASWPALTPQAWAEGLAARYPRWGEAAWQAHLDGFGLAPHGFKTMEMLSTGSQRKVLLAAALASGAPLTLLDLPEAALDRASIGYLHQALCAQDRAAPDSGRVLLVTGYEAQPQGWYRQQLALAQRV